MKRLSALGSPLLANHPRRARGGRWAAVFRRGGPGRSGPSPAECLLPQMQDRERRKRYRDDEVSARAPNKLIGYVSAGSIQVPGSRPPPRRPPQGRALVVALAVALVAIWLGFGGV